MTSHDDAASPDEGPSDEALHAELDDLQAAAQAAAAEDPGEPVEPIAYEDPAILTQQRNEYLDSLRRLQADFDNYRKRVARDQEMAADRASEKLITAMMPVLDTFEFALSHEPDPDASPIAKLHDQLLSALEGQGLERLSPIGEPFNPEDAEAVMHETGETESTDGPTVSEVLRAGYRWRGRVIRAAMVKVRD
jgi:molecular chaperone GrpE